LSIDKLRKKIFDLNEAFVTLDQKLNREYADELDDRENLLKFPTMEEIQSFLEPKDLFIETFQSDEHLYFIGFDQGNHILKEVAIDQISPLLQQYIEAVSKRPEMTLDQDNSFVNLSNKIYELTLKDILLQFKGKERALIVPDGLLSSVPFEALNTEKSDPYHFLMNDINITYLYSSRQIINEEAAVGEVNVLSLAPQFGNLFASTRSCSRDSLSSLPFARKESEYLGELFPGTFINSGDVKKSDLIENIHDHQVIHIATHACLNETNPMMNEIHFSDSYLTNVEIENQLASPELIVLGACYTANGKYIEGQGLSSQSLGD